MAKEVVSFVKAVGMLLESYGKMFELQRYLTEEVKDADPDAALGITLVIGEVRGMVYILERMLTRMSHTVDQIVKKEKEDG